MNLIEQLIRDEGERLKLYSDPRGFHTIGVGRNLDAEGISQDESALMLSNDIKSHTRQLLKACPWAEFIDEVRRAALINMTFNMGIGTLLKFVKFLALMRAKRYVEAGDEMLDSKWRDQVGQRAYRLSAQIKTGVWQ